MPTQEKSILLQAALDYAMRGWSVFPIHSINKKKCTCGKDDCRNPGKHPLTPHGIKDATVNQAVIRGWWAKWPDANIGLLTGKKSGLVVLDIDKKHDGLENLKKLLQRGNLPITPTVDTGGGGNHYYFAYNGHGIRNRTGLSGLSGIDIRGENGSVVAPPSRHISGDKYTWKISHLRNKLSPIPEWLQLIIEGETHKSLGTTPIVTLGEWNRMWAGVGEGQRNDTATRLAGRLLGRGMPHEEAMVILSLWNEKNKPPLSIQELRQAINSIAQAEARKPSSVMPAEYLMEAEIAKPPVLVSKGLLYQGSSLMITGESGAGKSILSLQLAIAISKGIPFLDMDVPNPLQVLFIQSENPKHTIKTRLWLLCSGLGVQHVPKIHFVDRSFRADLNNQRDRQAIKDLIEKVGAKVVVLDPLESYHVCNENDNIAMRNTLDRLTEISAATQCAWMVIHHEGKPAGDYAKDNRWRFRGASSIRNWADCMIGLIKKSHENRTLRILSFDKFRSDPDRPALLLERDANLIHTIADEDALVPMALIADCLAEIGGKAKNKNSLAKVIAKYAECHTRTILRAIDIAENRVFYMSGNELILIGKM